MSIKYVWYYFRSNYRDSRFTSGFYDATMGRAQSSQNIDYIRGYKKGVSLVQATAEEQATLVLELNARRDSQRKAEAWADKAVARMGKVKRAVAENL